MPKKDAASIRARALVFLIMFTVFRKIISTSKVILANIIV
ncbi:hypothetical protein NU08_2535 [Flavobacterium anhuiense]|uniref:Uncharacterized protein n=1 Tax=Flavobacterium anhuiense TaxID=459526 RepID=A0A444VYI7_9FLAO|nr:hypothetical protein NU08_2535 [Flavobacterium anhuiense]